MCGIVGCLALAIDADPDHAWVASATQVYVERVYDPIALGWEKPLGAAA